MLEFESKPSTPTTAGRRSLSSVSTEASLPGAIKKGPTRQRASSTAARGYGKATPACASSVPVLRVTVGVAKEFDVRVSVAVQGGRPDGRGLPPICQGGSTTNATYIGSIALKNKSTGSKGSVEIDGFDPVDFFLGGQTGSYVNSKGRFKYTALLVPSWDWRENGEKPIEGKAADIDLVGTDLNVRVRCATAMELKRSIQLQALNEAAEGKDYDTLRAQVTKAKMASVEMEHIVKGEARLKQLREEGLHVNEGCDHSSIRDYMSWAKVTSRLGTPDINETCTVCSDCPCNVEINPGEILEFRPDAIEDMLGAFGSAVDKQLFEALVDAALAVEEGCIWKAGGKYIFSEFNRNQSVTALTRLLCNHGQQQTAEMLQVMVKRTQERYRGFVTAIQVNFHPHRGTYHDQHRDIYSQKQSAGPNCTCQFQECIGTVCYTLGSSRTVLLETMTDNLSSIRPCGDDCEGRREFRWFHSGAAMFFNGDWNQNHTHGIPPCEEEECGPRISLAFLLAAKPPVFS